MKHGLLICEVLVNLAFQLDVSRCDSFDTSSRCDNLEPPGTARGPIDCDLHKKKHTHTHRKSGFAIRGFVDQDPTMAVLAMAILVHFWVLHWGL